MNNRREIERTTQLRGIRNLSDEEATKPTSSKVEDEGLKEHSGGTLREIDQRRVYDLESSPEPLYARSSSQRDGNGASSPPDFVRWGALGALLAGLAWTAAGIVSWATAGGRSPEAFGFVPLDEALYVVALVGVLGGLIGLHARQAPSYGRLGSVGFLASFVGVWLLLSGLVLSFWVGVFLGRVLGLGFLVTLVGFLLLGAATLWLGALPRWCGLLFIACLPLAITLGDRGGAIGLGLIWLAIGCVLLLRRDLSALFQSIEESGRVSKPIKRERQLVSYKRKPFL